MLKRIGSFILSAVLVAMLLAVMPMQAGATVTEDKSFLFEGEDFAQANREVWGEAVGTQFAENFSGEWAMKIDGSYGDGTQQYVLDCKFELPEAGRYELQFGASINDFEWFSTYEMSIDGGAFFPADNSRVFRSAQRVANYGYDYVLKQNLELEAGPHTVSFRISSRTAAADSYYAFYLDYLKFVKYKELVIDAADFELAIDNPGAVEQVDAKLVHHPDYRKGTMLELKIPKEYYGVDLAYAVKTIHVEQAGWYTLRAESDRIYNEETPWGMCLGIGINDTYSCVFTEYMASKSEQRGSGSNGLGVYEYTYNHPVWLEQGENTFRIYVPAKHQRANGTAGGQTAFSSMCLESVENTRIGVQGEEVFLYTETPAVGMGLEFGIDNAFACSRAVRINTDAPEMVLTYNFYVPEAGVYTFFETTGDRDTIDLTLNSVSPMDVKFDDGEWLRLSRTYTQWAADVLPSQATYKNEWRTPVLLTAGKHTVSFRVNEPRTIDGMLYGYIDEFYFEKSSREAVYYRFGDMDKLQPVLGDVNEMSAYVGNPADTAVSAVSYAAVYDTEGRLVNAVELGSGTVAPYSYLELKNTVELEPGNWCKIFSWENGTMRPLFTPFESAK